MQTRKSIGARKGSDDDNDFKPLKAPAAKRKVGESSRPKPTAKKVPKDEDVDMDVDGLEQPKARQPGPKRKAAKKVVKDETDDDDIVVVENPAAREKIPESAPYSDDDVTAPPPKPKPKAKEAQNRVLYVTEATYHLIVC